MIIQQTPLVKLDPEVDHVFREQRWL